MIDGLGPLYNSVSMFWRCGVLASLKPCLWFSWTRYLCRFLQMLTVEIIYFFFYSWPSKKNSLLPPSVCYQDLPMEFWRIEKWIWLFDMGFIPISNLSSCVFFFFFARNFFNCWKAWSNTYFSRGVLKLWAYHFTTQFLLGIIL